MALRAIDKAQNKQPQQQIADMNAYIDCSTERLTLVSLVSVGTLLFSPQVGPIARAACIVLPRPQCYPCARAITHCVPRYRSNSGEKERFQLRTKSTNVNRRCCIRLGVYVGD